VAVSAAGVAAVAGGGAAGVGSCRCPTSGLRLYGGAMRARAFAGSERISVNDHTELDFPFQTLLGFSIEHGDGEAWSRIEIIDDHRNPNRVAHGAIPFALMDTAMGGAVMSQVDEGCFCATIEIQTRFHRPASDGLLTAHARIIAPGRRVVQLSAETRDQQDQLIASATGSFAIIRPRSE